MLKGRGLLERRLQSGDETVEVAKIRERHGERPQSGWSGQLNFGQWDDHSRMGRCTRKVVPRPMALST